MRGPLRSAFARSHGSRITPACAGTTVRDFCAFVFLKDHPRLCGDHIGYYPFSSFIQGSPPPVRGPPTTINVSNSDKRITPACAGTTWLCWLVKPTVGDHPRLCGDHFVLNRKKSQTRGSPPPVRGPPDAEINFFNVTRITPACAGTTILRMWC